MKKKISILLGVALMLSMLAGCGDDSLSGVTSDNGTTAAEDIEATEEEATTEDAEALEPDTVTDDDTTESAGAAVTEVVKADFSNSDAEMFTDRDLDSSYNESESIQIQLNGTSATASADSVKISGTTVTITEEATYVITGTLKDGAILVEADDTAKLQIVLNGVTIKQVPMCRCRMER